MKKALKIVAITGFVVAAGVAQAQAAATDYYNNLMRAVYNTSGTDVDMISELSPIAGLTAGDVMGVDGFNIGGFAATDYANLNVAYFGKNSWAEGRTTYNEYWFSSTHSDLTIADITTSSLLNFGASFTDMTAAHTTDTNWTVAQSAGDSFTSTMGIYGNLSGILSDGSGAANLAGIDGGVTADMYLYHVGGNLNVGYTLTDLGLVVETGANYTAIADAAPASAVPVPGAVWLLGSGLAGLVGLKRKKS